ncbi:MAG: FAD-dependent oxidoreductase, partial [Thermodesulfobacteriota bacterium]|nr:FAD-dependent oxidoreductase [Thermodesulfobacteriota bacterium]
MGTIIVVGSGIAGDEAAHAASRTDPEAKVIMITEESHPLYSACVLADYVAGHISRDRVFLRKTEEYAGSSIDIQLSQRVTDWFPDQRMLQMQDRKVGYDSLILATGSQALIPPVHGVEKKGVITLKTLSDADIIKGTQGTYAVIVGSGPVGIEASLALRHLGWEVWIVELLEGVLPRLFDVPIATLIQKELVARGIRVHAGERLMEILGEEHVEGVRTDRRILKADLVLLVTGMTPEVVLAKKGGLALGP